jgi:hypothetical protein
LPLIAPKTWATNDALDTTNLNVGVRDPILDLQPLFVRKTLESSATSDTTLDDDTELQLVVAANCVYEMWAHIIYEAASAGDLKLAWNGPAGATLDWVANGVASDQGLTGAPFVGALSIGDAGAVILGGAGAGVPEVAQPRGILIVGTGGTFKARTAQGTSNATPSKVRVGSALILRRIA